MTVLRLVRSQHIYEDVCAPFSIYSKWPWRSFRFVSFVVHSVKIDVLVLWMQIATGVWHTDNGTHWQTDECITVFSTYIHVDFPWRLTARNNCCCCCCITFCDIFVSLLRARSTFLFVARLYSIRKRTKHKARWQQKDENNKKIYVDTNRCLSKSVIHMFVCHACRRFFFVCYFWGRKNVKCKCRPQPMPEVNF